MNYPLSNYVVSTAPTEEPLSVDEAKTNLRVDYNDDDVLIQGLVTAAREQVEAMTRRALISRTIDFYRDQFPGIPPWPNSPVIELPLSPVSAVSAFEYTDSANTAHNWTISNGNLYNETGALNAHIDTVNQPARIMLAYSQVWPATVLKTANAIRIRLVCGYGAAADVPARAKQAMQLMIGDWYKVREAAELTEKTRSTVNLLLDPLKVWSFA
jgi:uncharacterized phiE125 gp8 family phage protein